MNAAAAIPSNHPDPWRTHRDARGPHFIVQNLQSRRLVLADQSANKSVENLPNQSRPAYPVNHVASPSLPTKYGAKDMDGTSQRVARKPANTREEVRNGLHLALTRKIPTYRNPAKEVADLVDTSEGTVRSLRQANIPEAMVTLVMLGRAFPEFGAEVRRLMGMERDLDPDFQRSLAELMRRAL